MHNGVGLYGEVLAAIIASEWRGLVGRAGGDIRGITEGALDAVTYVLF